MPNISIGRTCVAALSVQQTDRRASPAGLKSAIPPHRLQHSGLSSDIPCEMTSFFKRRGSISSLASNHERESALMARIRERHDDGQEQGGIIDAIIAECRMRVASQPHDAAWRFYLGRFLMAAGDPVEARDELEAAALADPLDPRIHTHLGLWYEAALLAACEERVHVDLPPLAGPHLSASAARFGRLDEQLPVAALASRAEAFFEAALRFKLPRDDARYLDRHLGLVRTRPFLAPQAEASDNVTFAVRTA